MKDAEIRGKVAVDRRALFLSEWVGRGRTQCGISTNIQQSTNVEANLTKRGRNVRNQQLRQELSFSWTPATQHALPSIQILIHIFKAVRF